MTPSEIRPSIPSPKPAGGRDPDRSLEVLAIDFIDVNRSLTLAIQLANLARLWTHHAHQAHGAVPDSLGGLAAIGGEIDRLLLDCQYLLPRLAEVVDRYPNDLRTGSDAPPGAAIPGPSILIDGAATSLRPRAERDYGGDIAVAAADLATRSVLAAEARSLQLWREFGHIAKGQVPASLWHDQISTVTFSLGPPVDVLAWLAISAHATIAWLSAQFDIR